MEWVEVNFSLIKSNLICVADAPVDGAEDRHDHAAGKDNQPGQCQKVCHQYEEDASYKKYGQLGFLKYHIFSICSKGCNYIKVAWGYFT